LRRFRDLQCESPSIPKKNSLIELECTREMTIFAREHMTNRPSEAGTACPLP